ncbi:MAG: hypothetical protein UV67_C0009G0002 [Parcubacteria group bacterium GW2011_GWC1_43_12]|nr:MAG: hypothetical protein UV34_C0015G0027 [Parcubacteria group bacterium GW2011_GWB1_42_6]KKS92135.1 MAG: hypothetical protein UV67_C0009G0002 [Parcubacteria group bacterium GW2011_GWC1_43_12]
MWETIKKILGRHSGTCIIVEEGKPAYVITKFEDFQDDPEKPAASFSQPQGIVPEQDLLEKINQEIVNWKTKQAETEPEIDLPDEDELTIEKLPVV